MDFTNLLKFTITSPGSHLDKTRFVTLDYEATAFRIMKNLAEPLQTVFFTPTMRKVRSVYKVTFPSGKKNLTSKTQHAKPNRCKERSITAYTHSFPEHFLRSKKKL
jgi:hypothetical protein